MAMFFAILEQGEVSGIQIRGCQVDTEGAISKQGRHSRRQGRHRVVEHHLGVATLSTSDRLLQCFDSKLVEETIWDPVRVP